MAGDPARKGMAVLISWLTRSQAVESRDQDIPTQVPGTNFQGTQDSARVEWFNGPGACKIPERVDQEAIDDASQDKAWACVFVPGSVPGTL